MSVINDKTLEVLDREINFPEVSDISVRISVDVISILKGIKEEIERTILCGNKSIFYYIDLDRCLTSEDFQLIMGYVKYKGYGIEEEKHNNDLEPYKKFIITW